MLLVCIIMCDLVHWVVYFVDDNNTSIYQTAANMVAVTAPCLVYFMVLVTTHLTTAPIVDSFSPLRVAMFAFVVTEYEQRPTTSARCK